MQAVHLRKYGVETTVDFELYEIDGVDFRVDAAHAAGDSVVMKDEGAEASTTNGFTDEGKGYSIVLTATEMEAARVVVYVVDQTATKAWLDKAIVIETYGHASAMHAMDLDDAVRGGMTALPNAAADAAGGLPISDAGALDIDAKLANTNEVTAARMGALTDWINGGRLDLLLDAIKAVTDNLPDSGALTTIGTDTARLTAARAGALTDWINGGRLDLLLDAIPTTAMRGTDSAATEAKQDIIDTNVDSILVDTTQIKADLPVRLTKNTAFTNFMFKMVDATDGFTAETGKTITEERSIDGAAFGACANAFAEVGSGWYKIDLAASDLNGDVIVLRFTNADCRETAFTIITQKTA